MSQKRTTDILTYITKIRNSTIPPSMVFTENGAPAVASTGSECLNFFASVLARDAKTAMPDDRIQQCMEAAWREDPALSLRLLAHLRDCRGGKGERHAAEVCWRWLVGNQAAIVEDKIKHIPFYGRWSDLCDIFIGTPFLPLAMNVFADQLYADRNTLKAAESCEDPAEARKLLATISLAAKWAPTEDCNDDIRSRLSNMKIGKDAGWYLTVPSCLIAMRLWELDYPAVPVPGDFRGVMKNYRVNYLSPLRKSINVVERLLCAKSYDEIDFSKVPSLALLRYTKKCFPKHMPERFAQWQMDVLTGKKKVNHSQVDPYQVVERIMSGSICESELPTLEAFYQQQVAAIRAKGTVGNTCVVADTSSSMRGTPMTVAVAMAIWISACANQEWRDMFYSFNTTPEVVDLRECQTLVDRVRVAQAAPWGGSTDLLATFELMLTTAREKGYTQAEMPSRLIIISDMQFNKAVVQYEKAAATVDTILQTARQRFSVAGFMLPDIVFWNVRGDVDKVKGFPATSTEAGVAMISGFSSKIIDILLDNAPLPTPYDLMLRTLMVERYDRMAMVI